MTVWACGCVVLQEAALFPAALELFALDGAFDFDDHSFL